MKLTKKSWLMIGLSVFSILAHAKPIKIAVAGPFTGPNAVYGEQLLKGAELAAKDINQAGGIDGNNIVLVKADDACEPKQAMTVANRLINEDNVTAVIGHFCSSSTVPATGVYADADLLMITPAATNPQVTDRGFPTIFRMCGRDDQQGKAAADFIHDVLKSKNVAVIHDKDTYGKGLADATKAQLEKLGTKIALYEGITRGEKDFNALVTKLNQVKADAVYFGGMHNEAGPLLRQMREQGNQSPFISGDGIVTEEFVTAAGGPQMVKGVYMTFSNDPRNLPQVKSVVDTFRKQGYEPEGYTLYSYATLQVIADALKQTHSNDGMVLSNWLKANEVPTILGNKAWDKKGDLKDANYVIFEWNDKGKYVPYSPKST